MSKAFIQKISLPFNPLSVTGCVMWFDAFDASYTTSGNTVTGWTNKSGNSSATGTTGVLINQTTLMGKSSLRMSSGNLSIGSITYSTHFRNYFIVGNFINQQQLVVGDGNTQIGGAVTCGYYSDIELNYPGRNGIVSTSPSGNFGTPCILSLSTSTGNVGIWVTGNSQTININNLTPTFFATGSVSGQNIGSAVGSDFYELMVYDGIMTSAQRQQFEGYLAQKWGLTANLPLGHPGRSQTIYTSNYNAKNPGIATTPSPAMTSVLYTNYYALSISGCALWLDAADPAGTGIAPANGSIISSWVDKSGTGNNGTSYGNPTFVTSAFNGKPSISFNGSTQRFVGAITNTGNTVSVFAIVSMNSGGQWGRICSLAVTNNYDGGVSSLYFIPLIRNSTNQSIQSGRFQGSANVNVSPVAITYNVPFQAASIVNGTTNILYLNGTSAGSAASTGNFGYTAYGIGAQPSDLQPEYFQGFISEIIVYNSALTTIQRQQIEGYLAWKWGLQSSLINTNPYYSAAPLSFSRPVQVAGIPLIKQITHPTVPGYLDFYKVTSNDWTTSWFPYLQGLFTRNANATASSTLGTITGTSVGFYVSSFLAPNGLIYLVDNQNNPMGVITPTANGGSYSSTTVTGVGPYTQYGDNYKGGGLASDGIIYLVNFGAPGIGTLNTNTNVFTTNPFNVSPGAAAVAGGVLGPDGNIYCAPYVNLSQLFYFTPGANTINSFAISATVRYSKPFLAPNGKIYCVGSTKIVGVIDPIARTFTEVGTAANQQYGFMVLGGNGVVYAFPQNASGIGTLNLSTNVITANVIAGGTGYYGGILGPDGNIYLYQSGSGNIGVLNTKTNTLSILTYTSSGYICAVLAGNGNIYLGASHVIVFSGVSLTPTLNFCLTPYVNNGANRF